MFKFFFFELKPKKKIIGIFRKSNCGGGRGGEHYTKYIIKYSFISFKLRIRYPELFESAKRSSTKKEKEAHLNVPNSDCMKSKIQVSPSTISNSNNQLLQTDSTSISNQIHESPNLQTNSHLKRKTTDTTPAPKKSKKKHATDEEIARVIWLCKNSNIEELTKFLNNNGDPNLVDQKSDDSLLWISYKKNNIKMVKLLLSHGALPDLLTPKKDTTLIYASVDEQKEDFVTLLLQYRADPNQIRKTTSIPLLILAIQKQNINIINSLLHYSADANLVQRGTKDLPLYYAIQKNNLPIVELLINKGANVNYYNPLTKQTLLETAQNSTKLFNCLQQYAAIYQVDAPMNISLDETEDSKTEDDVEYEYQDQYEESDEENGSDKEENSDEES